MKPAKKKAIKAAAFLGALRAMLLLTFITWPLAVAALTGEWGFAWVTVAMLFFVAAAGGAGDDGYD